MSANQGHQTRPPSAGMPAARWTVYSCVIGDYDRVLPPVEPTPGARFVLYSADHPPVEGWTAADPLDHGAVGPSLANRANKIFGYRQFPDSEATLYVDGNVRILSDLTPLFETFLQSGADIALLRHPLRATVKEEVDACIRLGKADPEALSREYAALLADGHDPQAVLTENNVIFRRPGATLDAAMDEWWARLLAGSGRDQLSLPLVLARHQVKVLYLPVNAREKNPWFRIYKHFGKVGSPLAWRWHVLRKHRKDGLVPWLKQLGVVLTS